MPRGQGYFWWRAPNPGEQRLLDLFVEHGLPFRYVGNGEVWLGNRNPDFLNVNGAKQVIELFGKRHGLFDIAARQEHYKQYGYAVLVIWYEELRLAYRPHLVRKLKRFTQPQP